jgi:hypothetical protein
MTNMLLLVITIVTALVILGVAFVVLWDIVLGRIDLQYLVSEADGSASMSRFQLLIFTFVIALSSAIFCYSWLSSVRPKLMPPKSFSRICRTMSLFC